MVRRWGFGEAITSDEFMRVGPLGWDSGPYKKRKRDQTRALFPPENRESGLVSTQWRGSHLQARKRVLTRPHHAGPTSYSQPLKL